MHKQTIQSWLKQGLPVIDNKRPYLILGSELKYFITERQKNRKMKCADNELFCCKCRTPRVSIDNIVSIKIQNQRQANIQGICFLCGSLMNKRTTVTRIPQIEKIFNIESIDDKNLYV